jgi:uncharacterized protein
VEEKQMDDYGEALLIMRQDNVDYELAFSLLNRAIEKENDHRALNALSTWYLHGVHVKKNLRIGLKYARKAAELGNSQSAFNLAYSIEAGIGIKKNPVQAFQYYLLSALLGDEDALGHASRMCGLGHGVPKNKKLAKLIFDLKIDPVPYY